MQNPCCPEADAEVIQRGEGTEAHAAAAASRKEPTSETGAAVTSCGIGKLLTTANGCLLGLDVPRRKIRRTSGRNILAASWRGAVFLPAMLTLLA